MRDGVRNIIGQIFLIGSLLLIVIPFVAPNFNPELVYSTQFDRIVHLIVIAAAFSFMVGLLLLASTDNHMGG